MNQSIIKSRLIYFFNKKYCDDDNYSINFSNWISEVVTKNQIIHKNKSIQDREMQRRRRGRVYWIDFGKNIGSEFNDPHFCVVIYESQYTAIVVPISSEKETTPDWKLSEKLIVSIGKIEDLPNKDKDNHAFIYQMRSVSKQRLSNLKYNGNYIELKLTNDQMDIIDDAIKQHLVRNG